MRKLLLIALVFLGAGLLISGTPVSNCKCKSERSGKEIPLHGKVRVVGSFADFKVRIVSSFPSLKVKVVTSFPDKCGEWQFVESFPDFTVQFVESFEDFSIQYVTSFPGCGVWSFGDAWNAGGAGNGWSTQSGGGD